VPRKQRRVGGAAAWAALAASAGLFAAAFSLPAALVFELGEADRDLLRDADRFYAPETQTGPVRDPDGRVRIASFLVRATSLDAAVVLPAAWAGGPVKLRVRLHRYGIPGVVTTSWAGREVNRTEMGPGTAPWSGTAALLPRGPGEVRLVTRPSAPPRAGLPEDFGVAIDRLQIEREDGTFWVPTRGQLAAFATAVLLGWALARRLGAGRRAAVPWAVCVLLLAGAAMLTAAPTALRRHPWPAPLALLAVLALSELLRGAVRTRSEWGLRLLLLAAAGGSTLTMAELLLRRLEGVAAGPAPEAPALRILQPNPHGTGSYRLRPGVRVSVPLGRFTAELRTNRHGMPWRDVDVEPSAGTLRVAFLGDSFTFGCWAPDAESTYVGVFDARLRARGVEALNFGVGGYGPLDEELLLREEVLRFEPRVVVVGLFTGNDFRDAFLGLRKDRIEDGVAVLDEANVRERVPRPFVDGGPRRLRESERIRYERWSDRLALARRVHVLLDLGRPEPLVTSEEFVSYGFWSRTPQPPVALEAIETTWAAFGRMDALLRERGAQLAIVAIPTRQQVYSLDVEGPDFDVRLPQSHLGARAAAAGIPYLDLLPLLRESAREDRRALYLSGDPHLGPHGHRVAGELVADWFTRELLNAGASRGSASILRAPPRLQRSGPPGAALSAAATASPLG
jgi:hypothetical protein